MSFVMVDIESDDPVPGDFSMISFAAMVVEPTMSLSFEGKLKPIQVSKTSLRETSWEALILSQQ